MGSLFGLHFFLGMLLIGPVCLKIGSTVCGASPVLPRLAALTSGADPRRPAQRVLGPSPGHHVGGEFWLPASLPAVTGPDLPLQKLHQYFFLLLWLIIVIIHVVQLPAEAAGTARQPPGRASPCGRASGSRARWLLLVGSIIAGLALQAMVTYHLRARWGSWGGRTFSNADQWHCRAATATREPRSQRRRRPVAVEVGFEPTDELPHHTLSRRAPSATRRLHRSRAYLSEAVCGQRAAASYRRWLKKSRRSAAHSSARTPLTTSTGWPEPRVVQDIPDGPGSPGALIARPVDKPRDAA